MKENSPNRREKSSWGYQTRVAWTKDKWEATAPVVCTKTTNL